MGPWSGFLYFAIWQQSWGAPAGLLGSRKVQKTAPRAQNSAQSLVICSTGRDLEFALLGLCHVPIVDGPILKSWLAKNIGGGALEKLLRVLIAILIAIFDCYFWVPGKCPKSRPFDTITIPFDTAGSEESENPGFEVEFERIFFIHVSTL